MPDKQRTCKPRRVRINSDGSRNQEDMEHNNKCELKYMLIDNPWMKPLLNKKNPKGYDKYLKHLVKERIKTLKISQKSKSRKVLKRKTKKQRKFKKQTQKRLTFKKQVMKKRGGVQSFTDAPETIQNLAANYLSGEEKAKLLPTNLQLRDSLKDCEGLDYDFIGREPFFTTCYKLV